MPEVQGDFLASQIGQPKKLLLVAERNGAVVGYVFGQMEGFDYMAHRGPAAVLYDLVVHSAHRREGVGSAFVRRGLCRS